MALHFFPIFLKSQLLVSIPYPTSSFEGQTIIVSGSNTGLGLEAARHVARLGAAKLILAVRTISKGEAAAESIAASESIPRSRIEVWPLDMSDIESIKRFGQQAASLKRLDGAVLNAGVMFQTKWEEYSGMEAHLSVNVIGTTLLSLLLLPTLRRSARQTGLTGRLAIVGSDLMMMADRKELETSGSIIEKLNRDRSAPLGSRYPLSKLLVAYTVHELANRYPLAKSNVIITDLTPGACKSDLFREDETTSYLAKVAMNVAISLIARTTEVGSRTLVFGVDPELSQLAHGAFLMDNKIFDVGPVVSSADSKRLAERWNAELFPYLEKLAPGSTKT